MLPFGHAITQRPQPLHRSIFIIILPAIWINTPKLVYCLFNSWILTGMGNIVKTNRALIPVSQSFLLGNIYSISYV
jgi:hypothetical protein